MNAYETFIQKVRYFSADKKEYSNLLHDCNLQVSFLYFS